jgi:hypothetical protein
VQLAEARMAWHADQLTYQAVPDNFVRACWPSCGHLAPCPEGLLVLCAYV